MYSHKIDNQSISISANIFYQEYFFILLLLSYLSANKIKSHVKI